MKTRHGFVSNSSSSSFCIKKGLLTPLQIAVIENHIKVAQFFNSLDPSAFQCATDGNEWTINITDDEVMGYTIMDNFDMAKLLSYIGVPLHLANLDSGN
jgi:hypothetical protein